MSRTTAEIDIEQLGASTNGTLFQRIAVVNRGEPAVRLIKAVRELNAERGTDIKVVALHTESERGALFVRAADEGVRLRDVGTQGIPYLDHAELERALKLSKADAVWVGWGFVAEDAAFAELCARLNITFIGPSPEAMRRLGDKVEAKYMAEAHNVPVAPWSGGPVETMEDALEHAKAIGYPMILKARSGGGGRGIRIGSSRSPRPAAKSTSSSPESTSARSPIGTPKQPCSSTARAC